MTDSPQRGAHDGCPSCALAAGHAPLHLVHADDRLVAVIEAAPIRPGHLRIVPRLHYPHFNALPADLAREMLDLAERLAAVQRQVFRVDRVGFLFPAGGEPHAQVEAVPLLSAGDVAARRSRAARPPEASPPQADLAALAERLRRGLTAADGIGAMPWRPLPGSGVLVG